SKPAVGSS
ncbi:hypothetical protein CP061683_0978B, partial [Chlamydia psittaci 06-1683]